MQELGGERGPQHSGAWPQKDLLEPLDKQDGASFPGHQGPSLTS